MSASLLFGGLGLVTATEASAATAYTVSVRSADMCAAWTPGSSTGIVDITNTGGGPVEAGTLEVSDYYSDDSIPIPGSATSVSSRTDLAFGEGIYELTFVTNSGVVSPTLILGICIPAISATVTEPTPTSMTLSGTVPTAAPEGNPDCQIDPLYLNGQPDYSNGGDGLSISNATAGSFLFSETLTFPEALPDGAVLTGGLFCSWPPNYDSVGIATFTAVLPSPRTAFVKAAYTDFLGRLPSASELTTQVNALAAGTTRETVLRGLANSNEWLSAIVTKMYQDTLGRAPDPVGLATWVSWIRTGRFTVAQAAALFYSSDEFFINLGGSTVPTWVTQLYAKLLNRAPDAAGLAGWVSFTGAYGRAWVAGQFYQSLESRMTRVSNLYQALLHRGPDPTGWPFWADVIQRSGDIELAVALAASAEYYEKASARF